MKAEATASAMVLGATAVAAVVLAAAGTRLASSAVMLLVAEVVAVCAAPAAFLAALSRFCCRTKARFAPSSCYAFAPKGGSAWLLAVAAAAAAVAEVTAAMPGAVRAGEAVQSLPDARSAQGTSLQEAMYGADGQAAAGLSSV